MNQVLELEQAILARAQQLASQYAEQAQRTRDSILREAAERLRQREQREETIARALADRHYRQRVQAAELKLQSHLDQVRWNLVRGVEARLEDRMRAFIDDVDAYRDYLRGLIRRGAAELESPALTLRANREDAGRLRADWDQLQQAVPGKTLKLSDEPIETLAGVLLVSDDGRIRVDNTFEGRRARLRSQLQRVILERLLPASLESANLFTG
ncbi:H+-transporting two-sector ATPase, E subunit [Thioalkalivibrio nitratireducens DSM 14787]|uniref:V-type ATP synthase subunit E n=1 Tax=Thioalkalivibrio nitratireducens (strain DSM 14787 / UNIQEM 213 / ALEN2) TaxID=1255043 RepID=L0E441_THIND|nr:V-type ATP synthase subunit E family protein [Thioalkalivibrio nitratireducens]AGA35426.1 H+-transporting two-sector ATPase, E subunit [Thioalkalivibrio nitratireducens DSM 14787]